MMPTLSPHLQSEGCKTVILGAVVPVNHALPSQTSDIGDLDDVTVFDEAFAHNKSPIRIFYQVGNRGEMAWSPILEYDFAS